ncbi:MAG TPA: proline dehydrogenase family protein [Thermomicrobiaceae bacterium]|nr:proline dehydrogenase family protein [Thermomicrobiaceae bacterium]
MAVQEPVTRPQATDDLAPRSQLATTLNGVFRKGILVATHNRAVAGFVRRYGMRLGGARFVAGESLDAAVPVLRSLNQQGLRTNTTLLGEGVKDAATAGAVADTYIAILDRIAQEQLQTNIALKLTHLGLDVGEEVAHANVARVVEHAARLGNFIRIDMEESQRVDPTLRIYRRLREAGHDNVGTVLQSSLYRTERDLEDLLPLEPNLRLVKGAYLEPPSVAYPKKADVDRNYLRLAERMLTGNRFTAIATHDERIIDHVIDFIARNGVGSERFEFQMLYGIRSQYQLELVRRGFRVLVATPFGPEWYFYLMRRLAERPANVVFLLRSSAKR